MGLPATRGPKESLLDRREAAQTPAAAIPDSLLREPDHAHNEEHEVHGSEVLRIAFVALAAAAVWFHIWELVLSISVLGVLATLVGGYPIFRKAFENILE